MASATTACAFVIPGDITLATGGYAYDRHVLARFAAHGIAAAHVALPGSYPTPSGADIAATERVLLALPADTVLLIDGLAYGAMPADLIRRIRQPIVALVHHPLCLEAGLTPQRAERLKQLETEALSLARRVVVTSAMTGRTLVSDFAVPADKIAVAEPGTVRVSRPNRASGPFPTRLLAVGSVVPRKAYAVLAEALRGLSADLDWHLDIVGAARDAQEVQHLKAALAATDGSGAALSQRVTLHGAVDDATLAGLYSRADLFVMSSLYEGYGMVLAEAMAYGLPIVCTTGGAAAETVPDTAALKVEPGNALALRTALGKAMTDGVVRERLANASWAAGQKLPTWDDTTKIIAAEIARART